MLSLSTDEFDELDDEKITVHGVPFIAEDIFLSQHGREYRIVYDGRKLEVIVPGQEPTPFCLV